MDHSLDTAGYAIRPPLPYDTKYQNLWTLDHKPLLLQHLQEFHSIPAHVLFDYPVIKRVTAGALEYHQINVRGKGGQYTVEPVKAWPRLSWNTCYLEKMRWCFYPKKQKNNEWNVLNAGILGKELNFQNSFRSLPNVLNVVQDGLWKAYLVETLIE